MCAEEAAAPLCTSLHQVTPAQRECVSASLLPQGVSPLLSSPRTAMAIGQSCRGRCTCLHPLGMLGGKFEGYFSRTMEACSLFLVPTPPISLGFVTLLSWLLQVRQFQDSPFSTADEKLTLPRFSLECYLWGGRDFVCFLCCSILRVYYYWLND